MVWSLFFVISILIVVCCFCKYYDEPDEIVRLTGPQNARFVATDNYPGPPRVEGKHLGSTRCPSYSRAVRALYGQDRSPPPNYKFESKEGFLDAMKTVITDSFTSWFSVAGETFETVQPTAETREENQRTDEELTPTWRVV